MSAHTAAFIAEVIPKYLDNVSLVYYINEMKINSI